MGTAKATIELNGEPLAARAARVLTEVCDPVLEVGPGYTTLAAVREEPAGAGPLAALVAGAHALATDGPVVLLACDMPFVEPPLLQLLVDWPRARTVVPVTRGRMQYACARYGPAALDEATAMLQSGAASLRVACDSDCDYLPESTWRKVAPANALDDIDTPEDLARSMTS
jgi:molybdopterin-guanine dinucleotide biosynthesis protein A